jgi:NMD protein affecting ribosome stability and mRNA decay
VDGNDPTSICAWCGAPIEGMAGSHGICPECIELYFPEYAEEMKEVEK